jgi:ABC-type nitrate/sulfonate/bicarbonate transport system substrate-binding protein
MYRTNSSIARPRDMAEARIQYPSAPGPGGLAIVATMVEADGGMFDPEAVTPVNNGFYHTDALADGKADVATLAFYNFELVEAKQRGLDVGFFALKNWGVPDFCQLILTTSAPILEERHRVIQRFVEVLRRGIDCLHQRPGEAQSIYMQRTETAADDVVTGAIFQATLPCFTYDFTMAPAHYDRLAAWMHARGLIDSPVDSAACWTNDLAFPADPALSA